MEHLHSRDGFGRVDEHFQIIRPEVAAKAAHKRGQVHLGAVGVAGVVHRHVAVHAGLVLDGLHALTEGFPGPGALGNIFVGVLQARLGKEVGVVDHDEGAGGEGNGIHVIAVAPQAHGAVIQVVGIVGGHGVIELGAQAGAHVGLDVRFHDPEGVGGLIALQVHQQQAAVFRARQRDEFRLNGNALGLGEFIHEAAQQLKLILIACPGGDSQMDRLLRHGGNRHGQQQNGQQQRRKFLHQFSLLS